MVWTWGDPRDWDLVPDLDGWTYEKVLPYFQRSETYTGPDPSGVRGKHGPVILSSFAPNNATWAAVQTASKVFGVPVELDNNGGLHESVAIVQVCGILNWT
jgi:choline dehydrogenase